MLKRKLFAVGAMLAVAGMLVGFTGCTQAELLALQGTLKNVDSVTGTVTVTMKDGTTQTFNFNDVKIDTIKNALGNAAFEVGDNVTVKVRQNRIEEVNTKSAEVEGVIKSVGADNLTITTDNQDVTLKVDSQTKIRVGDNSSAALGDLKVGQEAEAKYDVSTMTALKLTVDTDDEGHGSFAQVEGIVKAVGSGNVTIGFGRGDNITLNISANTTIKIKGERTGSLQDIKVGQQVHASYDKTTNNAVRITLQGPLGHGSRDDNNQGENRQNKTNQTIKPNGEDNRQGSRDD